MTSRNQGFWLKKEREPWTRGCEDKRLTWLTSTVKLANHRVHQKLVHRNHGIENNTWGFLRNFSRWAFPSQSWSLEQVKIKLLLLRYLQESNNKLPFLGTVGRQIRAKLLPAHSGPMFLYSPLNSTADWKVFIVRIMWARLDCARKMLERCLLECPKLLKITKNPKTCYLNFKSC